MSIGVGELSQSLKLKPSFGAFPPTFHVPTSILIFSIKFKSIFNNYVVEKTLYYFYLNFKFYYIILGFKKYIYIFDNLKTKSKSKNI